LDHYHPKFASIKIDNYFQQNIEFAIELQNLTQVVGLLNSLSLQFENKEYNYISQKMLKKIKLQNKAALMKENLQKALTEKFKN
jgi:hypothetical protein